MGWYGKTRWWSGMMGWFCKMSGLVRRSGPIRWVVYAVRVMR